MRELLITRQFEKDVRKLPKEIYSLADAEIALLRENPFDITLDTKKLKGFSDPALYRLRVGVYRMLYSFTPQSLILHRIAHRKDIYR